MDQANRLPPIHPGEVLLEDFVKPLGLSASRLAAELGVPAPHVGQMVRCMRAISADTALRLSRYFGTSAEMWLRLQAGYDLEVAEAVAGERIRREVRVRGGEQVKQ
jgi:addiction module HigA family antidote